MPLSFFRRAWPSSAGRVTVSKLTDKEFRDALEERNWNKLQEYEEIIRGLVPTSGITLKEAESKSRELQASVGRLEKFLGDNGPDSHNPLTLEQTCVFISLIHTAKLAVEDLPQTDALLKEKVESCLEVALSNIKDPRTKKEGQYAAFIANVADAKTTEEIVKLKLKIPSLTNSGDDYTVKGDRVSPNIKTHPYIKKAFYLAIQNAEKRVENTSPTRHRSKTY